MAITLKKQNFAYAYVETGNACEAYRRAYNASKMSEAAIKTEAAKLMKDPDVTLTIEKTQKSHRARHEVTVDRLVQELANIVFANPKDYFEWGPDGVRVKESSELTDQQAAVVQEVYMSSTPSGNNIRVKLSDRQGAIDKLAKHLGMFIERKEVGGPGDFAEMSDAELDEFIRTEAAEVLPQIQKRNAPASRTKH